MLEDNAAATTELRALTGRLTGADLRRELGAGWTVAGALAHLAFWDRWQRLALAAWEAGAPLPRQDVSVNDVLAPFWAALDPAATPELALAAVEDLDAAIVATPEPVRAAIAEAGHAYILRRAGHRREHLAQIERGLMPA